MLEDPVPEEVWNTHPKFVVPLRSTCFWGISGPVQSRLAGSHGKSGWRPQICARQGGKEQPGQALNESGDKNTTFYLFSNDVFLHKGILIRKSILRYLLQLALSVQLTPLKIRTLELPKQHHRWDKQQPSVHSGFPFQTEDVRPPARIKTSNPTQTHAARNIFSSWRPGLGSVR